MITSALIFSFLMNWISWAIFGVIAGAIAKAIMPGSDPGGFWVTMLIGIIGAVLGGWISTLFLNYDPNNWSIGGFLVAIAGSLILLFIYRKVAVR
ncbi:GlsB/YeaQ/YmgE family stress response membrane protein [Faecalibacter rhinopitheci]